MVHVIITHEVKDFSEWKKGFDTSAPMREEANVKIKGVYTSVDNPNFVILIVEFSYIEMVHGYFQNPELQKVMEKAGVIGIPEVKIVNRVQ
jgi:hypothetical protein